MDPESFVREGPSNEEGKDQELLQSNTTLNYKKFLLLLFITS